MPLFFKKMLCFIFRFVSLFFYMTKLTKCRATKNRQKYSKKNKAAVYGARLLWYYWEYGPILLIKWLSARGLGFILKTFSFFVGHSRD